jgi:hypothetical protein
MKNVLLLMLCVVTVGMIGCSEPSPEPTTPPVQQEGQSPMERAMQGMPDNMREKYENQQK